MQEYSQSPTEDAFVQDPYAFYEHVRASGDPMFHWKDYGIAATVSYAQVWAVLRDRRFGREAPPVLEPDKPPHQSGFWQVEDHSLLEMEPPRHTRLRKLILRAFTSRRIAALAPEIEHLAHRLVDDTLAQGPDIDLLDSFARPLPVIIIARLLGVPENRADDLLRWSNAMVGMYQAGRSREMEIEAAEAASAFRAFMLDYVDYRRARPADDLITHLIEAEEDGEHLSTDELIATCILLLNAGHEATVHTIGNGVHAILAHGTEHSALCASKVDDLVEEILRFDPPLHMFQRWAYEDIEVGRHVIRKGQKVACLLAAANRDPSRWSEPDRFDPTRPAETNVAFGAGVHFCIGAPLARLELRTALPVLFGRLPKLALSGPVRYAQKYHFHGLETLPVLVS